MFYMHDIGWGWWFVMSIGTVAFWALAIGGIVWLIRGRQNVQQLDAPPLDNPNEILKRRLADSDISIEEYERLLETLDNHPRRDGFEDAADEANAVASCPKRSHPAGGAT
jgi:uncharacterized membrane protein